MIEEKENSQQEFPTPEEYFEYLAKKKGFPTRFDYENYIIKQTKFPQFSTYKSFILKRLSATGPISKSRVMIINRGFKLFNEYFNDIYKRSGYKSYEDYLNSWAERKGYDSFREYQRDCLKHRGIRTPSEHKTVLAKKLGLKNATEYDRHLNKMRKHKDKYKIFGEVLYNRLQEIQMTPLSLAKQLGIRGEVIYSYIDGVHFPKPERLEKILLLIRLKDMSFT
jgi:hypothetical protein